MAEAGLNLALVKFITFQYPPSPATIEKVRLWARTCEKYNIRFMPVINLWGSSERSWVRYKYSYTRKATTYPNTACPLEAKTFHDRITNRFVLLTKLSLSEPVAGVVLDTELYDTRLYAAGFSQYSLPCMCDYCFEKFLAGRSVPEPIHKGQRHSYLQNTRRVQEYNSFFRTQIKDLAKAAKDQVTKINPDFLIGCSTIDWPGAFVEGLAAGFSTAESPVLALSQLTYSGYGPYIRQAQSNFDRKAINARLIAGIHQAKFAPEYLAGNYYYCAKDSLGYWIYYLSETKRKKNGPPLGKLEDYWSAIQTANKELDRLVLNPHYQTSLKVRKGR